MQIAWLTLWIWVVWRNWRCSWSSIFFRDMELWVDNIIKIFRDNEICILLINNFFFFFKEKKKRKEEKCWDLHVSWWLSLWGWNKYMCFSSCEWGYWCNWQGSNNLLILRWLRLKVYFWTFHLNVIDMGAIIFKSYLDPWNI